MFNRSYTVRFNVDYNIITVVVSRIAPVHRVYNYKNPYAQTNANKYINK